MKVIIFLFLAAVATARNPAPKFTLVADRGETSGSPMVNVRFANGATDSLVLFRYHPNNEDRLAEKNACRYVGHLANEREACVAMTGCPGEDDVELTILSRHNTISALYKWNKDGSVDIIDREIPRDMAVEVDRQDNDQEPPISDRTCDGMPCPKPPLRSRLTVRFAYDDTFSIKMESNHSKAVDYIDDVMTHMQAIFCHDSLGTKIAVERVGEVKYYEGTSLEATLEGLRAMGDNTAKDLNGANIMVYMVNAGEESTRLGKAWVGVVCYADDRYQMSINAWVESTSHAATNVGHEIAHNLGIKHDFDHKESGCSGPGVPKYMMNNGVVEHVWSPCSKADYEAWYAFVVYKNKRQWCLKDYPDACSYYDYYTSTTSTTSTAYPGAP